MSDGTGVKIQTETTDDVGNIPIITYALYIVGIFLPIATLVGVIMAYVSRNESQEWVKTHYLWLIRTFWISILWLFIGIISVFFVIGWFVLVLAFVWYLVRVIRGLVAFQRKQPIAKPASWGF